VCNSSVMYGKETSFLRHAGPGAGDRGGAGLAVRRSCPAHGDYVHEVFSEARKVHLKILHLSDTLALLKEYAAAVA
jgi:hypothetical protein